MKCAAVSDYIGRGCRMPALKEKSLCYRHDPSYAERRREWAAAGHRVVAERKAEREHARWGYYIEWLELCQRAG